MRYEEFKEELIREMRMYVLLHLDHPEKYKLEDAGKNYKNNREMDIICVRREQDQIGLCIYPEKEYEEYRKGRTVQEIVKDWPGWRQECPEKYVQAVRQVEQGWSRTKDMLMLRLIQMEQNQNFLQKVPWRKLDGTDLGIMYQMRIDTSGSIAVTNVLAKLWKVGEEELYQAAWQNLQKEDCIFSAGEVMQGTAGVLMRESVPFRAYNQSLCYMVYADCPFGTAAVLNLKVMEAAERFFGKRFFLFPLDTERKEKRRIWNTEKKACPTACMYGRMGSCRFSGRTDKPSGPQMPEKFLRRKENRMSRLEELYNGELYPAERITGKGQEYRESMENIDGLWKELKHVLTEEEYALVEKLNEENRRAEAIRNQEGFLYGFRLAVQLLWEGMQPLK